MCIPPETKITEKNNKEQQLPLFDYLGETSTFLCFEDRGLSFIIHVFSMYHSSFPLEETLESCFMDHEVLKISFFKVIAKITIYTYTYTQMPKFIHSFIHP